jgi:hypothetical protein
MTTLALAMAIFASSATTALATAPVDVTLPGTADECDAFCTFWVRGEMDFYYRYPVMMGSLEKGAWNCSVLARGQVHNGGYMYIRPEGSCMEEGGGSFPLATCWDGPYDYWTGPIEHDGQGNLEPIRLSNVCITFRGAQYRGQATMELESTGSGRWSFSFDDQYINTNGLNYGIRIAGDLDEWLPLGLASTGFDLHPVF